MTPGIVLLQDPRRRGVLMIKVPLYPWCLRKSFQGCGLRVRVVGIPVRMVTLIPRASVLAEADSNSVRISVGTTLCPWEEAFVPTDGIPCRGTSLIRKRIPPGPYSRPMPRALR